MIQDRLRILSEYTINLLDRKGLSFDLKGKYLKHVRDFLENCDSVSKKGYNHYRKTNAEKMIDPLAINAICDLLDFCGIGYKRKKKTEDKLQPLEKLEIITERNKTLINDFLVWLQTNTDYSENTYRVYRDSLKSYFEYTNDFSIDEAKRYLKTMEEKGCSPSTIRLRITTLEKFGEWMKKPIKLKRPKSKRKLHTENIPTEIEYNKLLSHLLTKKDKLHYLQIRTLASTGARISEFLQFQWHDIINGEVTLKGKGNKYRKFFFSKSLQDEVRAYVKDTGIRGYVGIGKFGQITKRGFDSKLKQWGKEAGIDKTKMHAHAFRHFFAKMYLKKTKDVIQLADILGHGSIDTTRIYLQKSNEEQKRDFNKNVNW